jgi:hypothetical protein
MVLQEVQATDVGYSRNNFRWHKKTIEGVVPDNVAGDQPKNRGQRVKPAATDGVTAL